MVSFETQEAVQLYLEMPPCRKPILYLRSASFAGRGILSSLPNTYARLVLESAKTKKQIEEWTEQVCSIPDALLLPPVHGAKRAKYAKCEHITPTREQQAKPLKSVYDFQIDATKKPSESSGLLETLKCKCLGSSFLFLCDLALDPLRFQ